MSPRSEHPRRPAGSMVERAIPGADAGHCRLCERNLLLIVRGGWTACPHCDTNAGWLTPQQRAWGPQ